MEAIVQDCYGPPTFSVRAGCEPAIGDREFCHVLAAGLDRGSWHLMTGRPYLMRLYGIRRPRNPVAGNMSRHGRAVGSAVTRFPIGDEVFGICRGASPSRRSPGREARPHARESHLRAGRGCSVGRLYRLASPHGHRSVTAGQMVLITGASGASADTPRSWPRAGAEVTGVCSTSKPGPGKSLGADRVSTTPATTSPTAPPLRPDHRHRRKPGRVTAAARAYPYRDRRHRRRRGRRQLDRGPRPAVPGAGAVTAAPSAADHGHRQATLQRPGTPRPAHCGRHGDPEH